MTEIVDPGSPLALAIGVEVAHLLADVEERRDRERLIATRVEDAAVGDS